MSNIPFQRYIDIISGVGGSPGVAQRSLTYRGISTASILGPGNLAEFTSADDVGTFFGTTTEEYRRAVQYFGFISKNITKAPMMSFYGWAQTDTPARIFGVTGNYSLPTFSGISDGSIALTLGGITATAVGIDTTGATDLAGAAAIIQAAIRATNADPDWTGAAFIYDAVSKRFILRGGVAGDDTVAIHPSLSGTDLSPLIGFTALARYNDGAVATSITDTLTAMDNSSNNFGSFSFMVYESLVEADYVEAATWNDTKNNMYMFLVGAADDVDAVSYAAALLPYSGAALSLASWDDQKYTEMFPGILMATTDYLRRNSVKNYEYQRYAAFPATVFDNTVANVFDAARINYMGQTQQAGAPIVFFQQGYLMGEETDALDMGVYSNEMWLKDAIAVVLMALLLSEEQVPANTAGVNSCLAVIQSVIDLGLFNGVISVGKEYDAIQKQYISSITGDPNAWYQVQSQGYWIEGRIETYVESSVTKYKFVYTLVYGKGDSIRKVTGSNILI